jgi:hypothetical protein
MERIFFGSGWDPRDEFSFDGLNVVFRDVKGKSIPVQGYNRPRGFHEVQAPIFRMFVILRPINFRRQFASPSSGNKKARNAS